MPALGVDASESQDVAAALILLDLRYGGQPCPPGDHANGMRTEDDFEEAPGSSVSPIPRVQTPAIPVGYLHKKYQQEQRRWYQIRKSGATNYNEPERRRTREMGTQSDRTAQPDFEAMQAKIEELTAQVATLQEKNCEFRAIIAAMGQNGDGQTSKTVANTNSVYLRKRVSVSKHEAKVNSDEDDAMESDDYEVSWNPNHVLRSRSVTDNDDMVPIGQGKASVSSRLLNQIDWNSHTNATRKLLTAVFPRRVLATHSLTGKPSPAFPNKPAKRKLDQGLVRDIVQTVVKRCRVPESIVRTSITTKCADESKMLRSRQKKRRNSRKENDLQTSSCDED